MDTTFKEMMVKHRDINATKAVVDKPQLCEVLAEIEEKEISGGALVRIKDVKEILSKYFA